MASVYDYTEYREYLRAAFPAKGSARGLRAKIAKILGCQNGFVSSVFGGHAHFSLEHALKVSRFLNHAPEEQDFFLLLVQFNRAGSQELENYYHVKIKDLLRRRTEVRARLPRSSVLSEVAQLNYYSSWQYVAVHMATMIPAFRSRQAIAERLALPIEVVSRIVKFLLEQGVVAEKGDILEPTPSRFHLPADSPLVAKHHINWRMKAIASLDSARSSDLHYSLVMSVSEEGIQRIRALLLQNIESIEPILKAANDETLYTMNIDLFHL